MIAIRGTLLTMTTCVLAAAVGGALALPSAARAAEPCPNESLRAAGPETPTTDEPYSSALPDCRAYEQVSPVDKNLSDADGPAGQVQASPSGEGVTFFSVLPFPGVPGAGALLTYLATRGEGGWSTQGLLPESDPAARTNVRGLTEDMAYEVVEAKEPLLAPGAYRLLAPGPGKFRTIADHRGEVQRGAAVHPAAQGRDLRPGVADRDDHRGSQGLPGRPQGDAGLRGTRRESDEVLPAARPRLLELPILAQCGA